MRTIYHRIFILFRVVQWTSVLFFWYDIFIYIIEKLSASSMCILPLHSHPGPWPPPTGVESLRMLLWPSPMLVNPIYHGTHIICYIYIPYQNEGFIYVYIYIIYLYRCHYVQQIWLVALSYPQKSAFHLNQSCNNNGWTTINIWNHQLEDVYKYHHIQIIHECPNNI